LVLLPLSHAPCVRSVRGVLLDANALCVTWFGSAAREDLRRPPGERAAPRGPRGVPGHCRGPSVRAARSLAASVPPAHQERTDLHRRAWTLCSSERVASLRDQGAEEGGYCGCLSLLSIKSPAHNRASTDHVSIWSKLAATDRSAPLRSATWPARRRRPRPLVRICGGEVS
jgi:hypothetical protein